MITFFGDNMNLVTNKLTGTTQDLLTTEIKYFIAAAKAIGNDLIKLTVGISDDEKEALHAKSAVIRILKSIKKQGIIQLYVSSSDFNLHSTEVEYLLNKYPLVTKSDDEKEFFIIKI
jgi:hypothetical protein